MVAGYLIYDWNNMLTAVDIWTPPPRRPTVRALAREIDDTIGEFVRGRGNSSSADCSHAIVGTPIAKDDADDEPPSFVAGGDRCSSISGPAAGGRHERFNRSAPAR